VPTLEAGIELTKYMSAVAALEPAEDSLGRLAQGNDVRRLFFVRSAGNTICSS
jgi:hypothetical protein